IGIGILENSTKIISRVKTYHYYLVSLSGIKYNADDWFFCIDLSCFLPKYTDGVVHVLTNTLLKQYCNIVVSVKLFYQEQY
ncbi:hypothetical protein, partial [Candidatus Ichthyocystis hellenicum]|uniref:hypothetical protein n=1 Tax=Candidatus Ichthyocystis hellenicum TaxID=1561003 RepID=UPI001F5F86ED